MAIVPITDMGLHPGVIPGHTPGTPPRTPWSTPGDYSPWSSVAEGRSGVKGLLGWTPVDTTGTVTPPPYVSPYPADLIPEGHYPGSAKGYTGGLPTPDVPGYRYVYPMYEWEGSEGKYIRTGYRDDMDIYPYYPYTPGSLSDRIYDDDGKMSDRILIGVELIKD